MNKTAIAASTFLILALLIPTLFAETANVEWSKTYPRPSETTSDNIPITHTDAGVCVTQTSDEGYILVGTLRNYFYRGEHTGGDESYSGVLIKTNSSGEVEWQKEISASISLNAREIYQTEDSGFVVIAGYYIFGFDQQGQLISNLTLGSQISAAQQTGQGYVLICKNQDYSLVGTDKQFNIQWNKSLSFIPHDGSVELAKDSGGGYILVGSTDHFLISAGKNGPDIWIVKTDDNGKIQFSENYNFYDKLGIEQTNPVLLDNIFVISVKDGNYFLAGTAEFRDGEFNAPFLVKLDSQGNWLWSRTYASSPRDNSSSIQRLKRLTVAYSSLVLMRLNQLGGTMAPMRYRYCSKLMALEMLY